MTTKRAAKLKPKRQLSFRFRRGHRIGDIASETDSLLYDAFVDTGDLDILADPTNPQSIAVGRIGSGKTALLLMLELNRAVYRIDPTTLALRYLQNNTLLPHLVEIGVHLEPFYKLLWKHVLVMELIQKKFGLLESEGLSLFQSLANRFTIRSKAHKKALEYYGSWNPTFWETADVRVREITERLQQNIAAELGHEFVGKVKAGKGSETTIKEEQVERAQKVINNVSLEHIQQGIQIVREHIADDAQHPYYVVIDDLDKNWVDAAFAYDLIESLIDVVGEFARIPNVKVIVALRDNIVDSIYVRRKPQQQQREKHERLFLRVRWTYRDLTSLVDRRLQELMRGYYGGDISLETLLPPRHGKKVPPAPEYLLNRTLKRPRDMIDFVNRCIEISAKEGKNKVSWETHTTG